MPRYTEPGRRRFLKKAGAFLAAGLVSGCSWREQRRKKKAARVRKKKKDTVAEQDLGPANSREAELRAFPANQVKGIFGFKPTFPIFKGKNVEEIAKQVHSWGVNAVWMSPQYLSDPKLTEALHAWQIKVYTHVGMFMGWKGRNRPIQADGTPLQRYVPNHWYEGTCPNQPDRLAERLAFIQKIAASYDIDGLWLDGIRYPVFWETPKPKPTPTCFGPVCLEKFQRWTNIHIPDHLYTTRDKAQWLLSHHEKAWYKFRMDSITDITKQCREALKSQKPNAKLGIFGVPWRIHETRGGAEDAIERVVAQDYPSLAKYVDVFSPMVYHRMCGEKIDWIGEIVDWVAETTHRPVWPVIQAHGEPRCQWNPYLLSNGEFTDALFRARRTPSGGVIVFSLDYLVADGKLGPLSMNYQGTGVWQNKQAASTESGGAGGAESQAELQPQAKRPEVQYDVPRDEKPKYREPKKKKKKKKGFFRRLFRIG